MTQSVAKWWAKLFDYQPSCFLNPLPYLVPLSDLSTFLVIVAQCTWTCIFVQQKLHTRVEFDTSSVFAILTATLGFILPLQMNAALIRNKACLDTYNAFTGDLRAFGWDVVAFHTSRNVGQNKKSQAIISYMFDILVAMPALAKWHFRGDDSFEKLTTKSNTQFRESRGGRDVMALAQKIPSMPKVESCFFKLLDYMKDMGVFKTQQQHLATTRSWERAFASWGKMGNLSSYKYPMLFTYVLNGALFLYSIILPFQFVGNGYHAVWMVAIVGYFFIGLHTAGTKVGNAFAEETRGFLTVSDAQRDTTKALNSIWESRGLIFEDPYITQDIVFY